MEKLIELLNEYEAKLEETPLARRKWREERGILYRRFMNVEDAERMVISKSFGFIKWLVENEKIEYRKIIEKEIEVGFKLVRIKDYPNKIMEEDIEELLMLLAIQDEPIKFLNSILK